MQSVKKGQKVLQKSPKTVLLDRKTAMSSSLHKISQLLYTNGKSVNP